MAVVDKSVSSRVVNQHSSGSVVTSKVAGIMNAVNHGMAVIGAQQQLLFRNAAFVDLLPAISSNNQSETLALRQYAELTSHLQGMQSGECLPHEARFHDTNGLHFKLTQLHDAESDYPDFPGAEILVQVYPPEASQRGKKTIAQAITIGQETEREKRELLAAFSHEFRTPLNAVLGFGRLLETEENQTQEQKEYIEGILNAGGHLLKLVNEILTLAKADHECAEIKLKAENVDVSALAAECLALAKPLAVSADLEVIGQMPAAGLICDRTRLKQVILNLLSNAIKYNRPGGRVIVNVRASASRCLGIEVQDTGRGIEAELQDTIFKPFERLSANNQSEGSGIGLMITRRLINMMGGQIRLVSAPGRGSVFSVDLNLDEQLSGASVQSRQSILWVGEAQADFKFARQLVSLRGGLTLHRANSLQEVNALMAENSYRLIVLDESLLEAMDLQHGTYGNSSAESAASESGSKIGLVHPDSNRKQLLLESPQLIPFTVVDFLQCLDSVQNK